MFEKVLIPTDLSTASAEKKIQETYGIHIPHHHIYRVLLNHRLVEINMKNRQTAEVCPV